MILPFCNMDRTLHVLHCDLDQVIAAAPIALRIVFLAGCVERHLIKCRELSFGLFALPVKT